MYCYRCRSLNLAEDMVKVNIAKLGPVYVCSKCAKK